MENVGIVLIVVVGGGGGGCGRGRRKQVIDDAAACIHCDWLPLHRRSLIGWLSLVTCSRRVRVF